MNSFNLSPSQDFASSDDENANLLFSLSEPWSLGAVKIDTPTFGSSGKLGVSWDTRGMSLTSVYISIIYNDTSNLQVANM